MPQEDTRVSTPAAEQRTPVSVPMPPSPPSAAKRRKTPASQVPGFSVWRDFIQYKQKQQLQKVQSCCRREAHARLQ